MLQNLVKGVLIFSIVIVYSCGDENATGENSEAALFQLLDAKQTGVDFQNRLTEGPNTNILMYEYFFNGGGVAVGDFNNDGLEDLYFTSNMSDNKLYLNRGNMLFKDITALSGAAGRAGPWKTGVTTVDINGDGLLDIYVCYSGALPPEKRANQLFVNQGNSSSGNPTFQEMAYEYGLNLTGFSNQAYFFDYDLDGDLDMIMLNHNPKNLPILNVAATKQELQKDDAEMGLRLLRNDNGKFKDVTSESGINGSPLSYGLGVAISDLNNDGLPDFYVSNDYTIPDYLYINIGNGKFRNELSSQMGHTSMFSMGNDVADVNNDGYFDLLTLDMLPEDNKRQKLLLAPDNFGKFDLNVANGFYYQYMRNMLQLNNGNGTFSEVGQLLGVSNTDWSWSALLADYDNDGFKDLYVTNGYFKDYTNLDFIKYMDGYVQEKGRLTREAVLEIVDKMPASNVVNYLFQNKGGNSFQNMTQNWGVNYPSNSNGAAYADLDNDGDLDLIVNNINQPAFIFQNQSQSNYLQVSLQGNSPNTLGLGAKVELYSGNTKQVSEQNIGRGYLSSVSPILQFGLGEVSVVDSLKIIWPNGKMEKLVGVKPNQRVVVKEENAVPNALENPKSQEAIFEEVVPPVIYTHDAFPYRDFDRQLLLVDELSFQGPILAKADINNDGLSDVFIGGAKGQKAQVFIQKQNNSFQPFKTNVFEGSENSEDTDVVFGDFNHDGLTDFVVSSGGYHDFKEKDKSFLLRMYLGNQNNDFDFKEIEIDQQSISSLVSGDFNGDGFIDLFLGGGVTPGKFPTASVSMLLINDGEANFQLIEDKQLGMVSDLHWEDLDNDGSKELIVISQWKAPSIFKINNGKLIEVTKNFINISELQGIWNVVKFADLNSDGKLDWILGNRGVNSQLKATFEEPAALLYGDFDENGSIDPILSFYIEGEPYPYLTKEELGRQMPKFNARFETYESFSEVTTSELLSGLSPERYTVNELRTVCLMSKPDGSYKKVVLPQQAQYAPIEVIEVRDINKDGFEDLILLGNNSHSKLRLGKYDANYGCVLLNDGKGSFNYLNQVKSGLKVRGDVRSSLFLDNIIILGLNGKELKAYKLN